MREIHVDRIAEAVREVCLEANYVAGTDVRAALAVAEQREVSPLGRQVLGQLLENIAIAEADRVPMCQDTGTVVVFAEVGQEIQLVGGGFEEAIDRGVHEAYDVGYLRKSMVERPFSARRNTRDNTPAVVHTRLVPGDRLLLALLAKGGGAENMSRLAMLTPADGRDGVKRFAVETVRLAGPNACPPVIVGLGIGGTFDSVATLAKHALLRDIGSENPDPEAAALEAELLTEINRLGIGPHGFGGRITALAVHVESAPCHIASLPVAVNLQCGPAARHRVVEL
ncbi:MAG TPA: fumarate hydratase [Thermomicrobiaceae bacterium]|nr:fumarate hydratase [Thermomicrobiaceae bacterium]